MSNTQTLQGEHSRPLLNSYRRLFSTRSLILILALAFCLMSLRTTALGQSCFAQCQQGFSTCLQGTNSDPLEEARCQDDYDRCADDCM